MLDKTFEILGQKIVKSINHETYSVLTVEQMGLFGAKTQVIQVRLPLRKKDESDLYAYKRDIPVIITTIQKNIEIIRNLKKIGFENIINEKYLLIDKLSENFTNFEITGLPKIIIDPKFISQTTIHGNEFSNWINAHTDEQVAVVAAPAGFGKTVFCKNLFQKLNTKKRKDIIPIYISSEVWAEFVSEIDISIQELIIRSISKIYPKSALGEKTIFHLIQSGTLLPIFDGLDELCASAYNEINIDDVISQINELIEDSEFARVLITSRKVFWENIPAHIQQQVKLFELDSFGKEERDEYINRWFDDDEEKNILANKYISRIDNISGPSGSGSYRLICSPYILWLIVKAIDESGGIGFDEHALLQEEDLIDGLLVAVMRREKKKISGFSSDNLSGREQILILMTLSLFHENRFSDDEIYSVAELYSPNTSFDESLLSHHLFESVGNYKRFVFDGLADYIRAKAICRWLFRDEEIVGVEEYLSQIRSADDMSLDILTDIMGIYIKDVDVESVLRGFVSFSKHKNLLHGAIITLIAIYKRFYKKESIEMFEILCDLGVFEEGKIRGVNFCGEIEFVNFPRFEFVDCIFEDVVFKNSSFEDSCIFKECSFINDFQIYQCEGRENLRDIDTREISLSAKGVFASSVESADNLASINVDDINYMIEYVVDRMANRKGGYERMNCEQLRSYAQKKNYFLADDILSALEKENVLEVSRKSSKKKYIMSNPQEAEEFRTAGLASASIRKAQARVRRKHKIAV